MPKRIIKEYIHHILDEIDFLIRESQAIDDSIFMRDAVLQRAFVRSLEIIGEAVKNLPADYRSEHQDIDWQSLAGLRDKLIHHYFGVDYEIVWDVVVNELPVLKEKIDKLVR